MSVVYINGKFVAGSDAKISVFDRSYLFGEGLFESFRSFDGKVPFLDSHLNRMEWSSTVFGVEFPTDIAWSTIVDELLEKNGLKDARFKIILSRMTDSMVDAPAALENAKANVVVFCESLDEKLLKKSYKLKTVKTVFNDCIPICTMKTTNYLSKIFARHEALESGFDEALMLNAKGMVSECSSANLFWIDKDGVLHSVLEDQGLLRGTTANAITQLLKDNKINIKPAVIRPEELSHAKEIFITNSIIGVRPVISLDGRQISGGEIGSITAMISDLWNKHIQTTLDAK